MIHARHSSLDGLDPIRGNAFCCACWVKLTLKTGAVCTYKTSAGFNQTTRSHIQVQQHRQYVPTKRRQVSNRLQEVTSKFSNTGSMYLQNVGRFQPDYKKSHPSSAVWRRDYTPHSLGHLWFSRRWALGLRASGPWRNVSMRLTGYTVSDFRRSLFFTRYQHDFCKVRRSKRSLSILSTFHHTCTFY